MKLLGGLLKCISKAVVTRCEVVRLKPVRWYKMVPFEAKLVKSGQVETGPVATALNKRWKKKNLRKGTLFSFIPFAYLMFRMPF